MGPRRQVEWSRLQLTATSTGGLLSVNLMTPLEAAMGRVVADYTVTRIIVSIWFQGGVALGEFAMGIICDDRAAPILDPTTDEQIGDWMWVEKVVAFGDVLERASASWSVGGPLQNIYRDLGSQRKCNLKEAPHFAIRNVGGSASTYGGSINTLVKFA